MYMVIVLRAAQEFYIMFVKLVPGTESEGTINVGEWQLAERGGGRRCVQIPHLDQCSDQCCLTGSH